MPHGRFRRRQSMLDYEGRCGPQRRAERAPRARKIPFWDGRLRPRRCRQTAARRGAARRQLARRAP
eukprot:358141-Chlamydomonas_euryale.AAC.2